jgi:TolB-like protein/class 3 adenylate cyclase/Tfp pilus assembly protein PilF
LSQGQRRLAAILAADVAGYSRLMAADESGTLARLTKLRTEVIEPKIAQFHGRIVGSAGDSLLVEFFSAINAVQCAVEAQEGLASENADLPEDRRMIFRMGVNLGDVIARSDTIHGDGVNIAARLEKLAEPGSVCIGRNVYDQVRGKLAYAYADLGEQRLHNIPEPVRVYCVKPSRPGAAASTEFSAKDMLPLPDKPSIAVLPFANMSGDPEQEYFADGVVEEIITALSRIRWLFVIARNSTFTYKGRAVDVKQIGRELGVRYVLEGSVRKAGNKIRITGQLVDSAFGAHLWADRFDGSMEDIFDLQDRVTASVVAAVAPKLEQVEIERSRRKPTGSLDAYDYYLRGLAATHLWTKSACAEALAHFYRAIELDPGFASAYGMAARCYSMRKVGGWVEDRAREAAEADRLARRAAGLGPDDAVALAAAGIALGFVVGDLDRARDLVERATALDANMAWAWLWSGWTRVWLGEPEVAREQIARALRLSPLDSHRSSMFAAMATTYFMVGRYDEALVWIERGIRERGGVLFSTVLVTASAALAGNLARAQETLEKLRGDYPNTTISALSLPGGFPFRRPQDIARLAEGLRKAGLPE